MPEMTLDERQSFADVCERVANVVAQGGRMIANVRAIPGLPPSLLPDDVSRETAQLK